MQQSAFFMSPYAIPGLKRNYIFLPSAKRDPAVIIDTVAKHYNMSVDKLKKRCRKREFVLARHACFVFLRLYTTLSLQDIGDLFDMDRTSVMHGIHTAKDLLTINEAYRLELNNIFPVNPDVLPSWKVFK